jgi:adenylate cyclase
VQGERAVPDAPDVPLRGLAALAREDAPAVPFVGRLEQRAALWALLAKALDGAAQVVAVQGEAGLGKTRLVAEFAAEVEATVPRPRVLRGGCRRHGGVPYGPFVAALDDAALRARLTQGGGAPGGAASTAQTLEETTDAVRGWLAAQAVAHPVVLVLEDLQWADSATLALLEALVAAPPDCRLLVVAVHRPMSRSPFGKAAARATVLHLEPLRPEESHALLDGVLDGAPDARRGRGTGLPEDGGEPAGEPTRVPPGLRDRILAKAEGNPLYLEETLRALIETGVLERTPAGRWRCASDPAEVPLPDSVQAAILARLDRLEGAARQLLQEASIIGRVFADRVLQAVTEVAGRIDAPLRRLEQALADAERAVQVGPKAALAYLARGRALAAAGRTAEARQDLTEAIALGAGGQLAPLAAAELSRSATP